MATPLAGSQFPVAIYHNLATRGVTVLPQSLTSAGERLTRCGKYSWALSPGGPVADPRLTNRNGGFRPAPSFNAAVSIGNVRKRLPIAAMVALITAGAMAEVMRRAFGQPPQMIRRNARAETAA